MIVQSQCGGLVSAVLVLPSLRCSVWAIVCCRAAAESWVVVVNTYSSKAARLRVEVQQRDCILHVSVRVKRSATEAADDSYMSSKKCGVPVPQAVGHARLYRCIVFSDVAGRKGS